MNVLDEIVGYFRDNYYINKDSEIPKDISEQLNQLDRAQRGELKARLANEAKKLAISNNDGVGAIRWLDSSYLLIERNSFRLHEVLFSPGQDIPENLGFYLSQAKRSIDICVYTISDEKLARCLIAMHKRGIKVRIITDNHKMQDAGSQIKAMAREGVSVKIDNSKYHMHNKFGIIDNRIIFTGSYNWTYTAQQHNQENLILTTNYTIVHKFMDEFAALWESMYWLKVQVNRKADKAAKRKEAKNFQRAQDTNDDVETKAELEEGIEFPNIDPFDPEDYLVPEADPHLNLPKP
ncbi:MAG: phospholipase D-like domain-containing protein [Bacteroidales bacterium]|nr:phospholipase D-like domain-containing protein [Bacteroidales bacterium]